MTVPLSHDVIEQARHWRLDLHRHPELAFREHRTGDMIARVLDEAGIQVHRGHGRTGVVGTLARGSSSRSIAIRADMDALPIEEQTGASHASVNPGIMHACGHDGHVAMLLAAARLASTRDDLDGAIHFVFQPAEEVEGGARVMVADGLFRDFAADAVYALHNWPALAPGQVAALGGAMMAAFATFEIEIRGRGGHGAMPHETVDPVVAAGQLVSALQSIASRNVSPLKASVVSVTQMSGGDAYNVIPEAVVLRGTTRWFEPEVGDLIEKRIAHLATHVCRGFDCEAKLRYDHRYPATVNDGASAAFLRSAAGKAGLTVVDADPSMAAEDFAFMLREKTGAYLWLGAGREGSNPGLHSPRFDFNDAVLPDGIALWNEVITQALVRNR